jgi:hypothetical protein
MSYPEPQRAKQVYGNDECGLYGFGEWLLGILANVPGVFSYSIEDGYRCRRTNDMEQL